MIFLGQKMENITKHYYNSDIDEEVIKYIVNSLKKNDGELFKIYKETENGKIIKLFIKKEKDNG